MYFFSLTEEREKNYFLPPAVAAAAAASSSLAKVAIISCFLIACLSSRLFLASLTLVLMASAWSVNCLVRAFSAFFLWMNSMRTRLFLNTLPLAFKYSSWYKWRSIFLASRYLLRRRRKTRIRFIHISF